MALSQPHARRLALLLLLLFCAGAALAAYAQTPVKKKFDLKKKKGEKALIVSVDFGEIFDAKAVKKLDSGLPTVVLTRLFMHTQDSQKPLSMVLSKCKVIYDVWEEDYIITQSEAGKDKTRKVATQAEAAKLCGGLKGLRLPIDEIKPGTYQLSGVVDLNPMSKEVLEAMRDWLKRPLGDSGLLNPADSFFGSFITIFVNDKIEPSEKTIKLTSQLFKVSLNEE